MENRIMKLREKMEEKELEAFLISSAANRRYLTGFTGTAGYLLLLPEENIFITDFRYKDQAKKQVPHCKIVEISSKIIAGIGELLAKNNIEKLGLESDQITYHDFTKYRDTFKGIELAPVAGLTEELRLYKDESEISNIKKAVEIADLAFAHIIDFIKVGKTEKEVALELEFFMKKAGGEDNAFDFIVASGERSALPHGVATDKVIEYGDFVTMDYGTIVNGYCSDITRTIVVGEANEKQKEIYQLVLKAQKKVISKIKAGLTCKEVDAIARDIIKENGYAENFGHGLGHGLGLNVHEGPRLSYTSDDKLEKGMVVTDEPGIYLSNWGGVRIEDDLLITANGCQVLNKAPKELIVV